MLKQRSRWETTYDSSFTKAFIPTPVKPLPPLKYFPKSGADVSVQSPRSRLLSPEKFAPPELLQNVATHQPLPLQPSPRQHSLSPRQQGQSPPILPISPRNSSPQQQAVPKLMSPRHAPYNIFSMFPVKAKGHRHSAGISSQKIMLESNEPITFYQSRVSPSCARVLLLLRLLNKDIHFVDINLSHRENTQEEYLKINPAGQVPTIVDGNLKLSQSRAILRYLCNAYALQTELEFLYPLDTADRSQIDMVMEYDASVVNPIVMDYVQVIMDRAALNTMQADKLENCLSTLERLLIGKPYFCSGKPTIADISVIASIVLLDASRMDLSEYPLLNKWLDKMRSGFPYFREAFESIYGTIRAALAQITQDSQPSLA